MGFGETFLAIVTGLGLSVACGFRLLIPLFSLSIATTCEVITSKFPIAAEILDIVEAPFVVIAGVMLELAMITDLPPVPGMGLGCHCGRFRWAGPCWGCVPQTYHWRVHGRIRGARVLGWRRCWLGNLLHPRHYLTYAPNRISRVCRDRVSRPRPLWYRPLRVLNQKIAQEAPPGSRLDPAFLMNFWAPAWTLLPPVWIYNKGKVNSNPAFGQHVKRQHVKIVMKRLLIWLIIFLIPSTSFCSWWSNQ